jgi:hypothetical protein
MRYGNDTDGFHDPADSSAASYSTHPVDQMEPLEESIDFRAFGSFLARVYVWVSEARDIVGMGKRQWVQLYVLRPDLIRGQTMDQFGALDSTSRQGMDKLVQEFRATFGIRGRNMRSDETRLKCQQSHL